MARTNCAMVGSDKIMVNSGNGQGMARVAVAETRPSRGRSGRGRARTGRAASVGRTVAPRSGERVEPVRHRVPPLGAAAKRRALDDARITRDVAQLLARTRGARIDAFVHEMNGSRRQANPPHRSAGAPRAASRCRIGFQSWTRSALVGRPAAWGRPAIGPTVSPSGQDVVHPRRR